MMSGKNSKTTMLWGFLTTIFFNWLFFYDSIGFFYDSIGFFYDSIGFFYTIQLAFLTTQLAFFTRLNWLFLYDSIGFFYTTQLAFFIRIYWLFNDSNWLFSMHHLIITRLLHQLLPPIIIRLLNQFLLDT